MPETAHPRLQPHDLSAERRLLGACLLDASVFAEAKDALEPMDFYATFHQRTWEGMLATTKPGLLPDPIMTGDWLKAHGYYTPGNDADLHELWADVAVPAAGRSCIPLLIDLSERRRLIVALEAWSDAAYAPECSIGRLSVVIMGQIQDSQRRIGRTAPVSFPCE